MQLTQPCRRRRKRCENLPSGISPAYGGFSAVKIYLTARWERQSELRNYRNDLLDKGHEIMSSWLDVTAKGAMDADGTDKDLAAHAAQDLQDIADSDLFVLFTELGAYPRGGRMVELGYALARQERALLDDWHVTNPRGIAIIGPSKGTDPRENVFCHLDSIHAFETWPLFLAALEVDAIDLYPSESRLWSNQP